MLKPPHSLRLLGRVPRRAANPGSPATPEDLTDIAKLANLPAWVKSAGDGDFSTGPDYTPAPEETQRVGIPHGKLVEFFMNSASSNVFPGVNGPFERLVSVYIPAQYVPGRPAPFIFAADSYGLRDRQLANILDNMIADRRLLIFRLHHELDVDGDAPASGRGLGGLGLVVGGPGRGGADRARRFFQDHLPLT